LEEQKFLVETITAIRLQAAQARENAVHISDRIKADIEAMILGTKKDD
jgi:hypothetical protein